ncbi:MAG: DUF4349 domain-containing protein, partial [Chloroflexi bacterium]|nr:DUF4349 domain-containing protein [Chloroflexota bacterium]
ATITLRVPAQGYADVMTALRRMSVKVESEKGEAKDVTEEFADIDAQVRNLEVTEAQLQELMKKATTIDEILRVQNQISTVRGQIERLKGRAQYLQRNADLATITVTLAPELPAKVTVETPVGWDPLRVAAGAWRESLRAVQAVLTVGIVTVVFFWWLLPPLALFGFWMMSRRNGRRAAPAANAAP